MRVRSCFFGESGETCKQRLPTATAMFGVETLAGWFQAGCRPRPHTHVCTDVRLVSMPLTPSHKRKRVHTQARMLPVSSQLLGLSPPLPLELVQAITFLLEPDALCALAETSHGGKWLMDDERSSVDLWRVCFWTELID